jgi:hypothetical protein
MLRSDFNDWKKIDFGEWKKGRDGPGGLWDAINRLRNVNRGPDV